MPVRSSVAQLPDEVRSQLDRQLIQSQFSGYEQLAQWLQEQGYEISKSAVHRYGKEFEARVASLKIATEQARAIVDSIPDDQNAMSEALLRLCQEKAFGVLMKLEESDDEETLPKLSKLTRAVSALGQASISVKRYATEARERAAAAAKVVAEKGAKAGLSEAVIREIEEQILGIVR